MENVREGNVFILWDLLYKKTNNDTAIKEIFIQRVRNLIFDLEELSCLGGVFRSPVDI